METSIVPHVSLSDITPATILQAVIGARGNLALAAERMSTPQKKITEVDIIRGLIAQGMGDILQEQIKILTTVRLFELFEKTQKYYLEALPILSPKDTAKAFTNLVSQIATLTQSSGPTPQQDNAQALLSMLPAEVREALLHFTVTNEQ